VITAAIPLRKISPGVYPELAEGVEMTRHVSWRPFDGVYPELAEGLRTCLARDQNSFGRGLDLQRGKPFTQTKHLQLYIDHLQLNLDSSDLRHLLRSPLAR
jgi:hypothetical protein